AARGGGGGGAGGAAGREKPARAPPPRSPTRRYAAVASPLQGSRRGAASESGRLRHGDRGQGPGDRRRMALMSTILLQACPSLRRSYCPPLEWDVLSSVGNGQDVLRKQRGRLERSIGSPHSPHVPF